VIMTLVNMIIIVVYTHA